MLVIMPTTSDAVRSLNTSLRNSVDLSFIELQPCQLGSENQLYDVYAAIQYIKS